MSPIRFDIVGGGFRTQAYLQIAHALPDRFQVGGLFVRDEAKGRAIEEKWHIQTYRTLEELLQASERDFMLVSLGRSVTPSFIQQLVEQGVPVLTETPPAQDLEALLDLYDYVKKHNAKIQIAEQYHFHPLSPLAAGPTRAGLPTEDKTFPSKQIFAFLNFGDKLGVYDFCGDQYRSWIRSARVLVRGDRGEINNAQVRYLEDILTPISYELERQDSSKIGNLEGLFHRGYMAAGEWIYRNPFMPGRLNDDEIATATCLEKMAEYVAGGLDFYGLEDASQDHYLSLMIHQALVTHESVQTSTQSWGLAD